MLRTLLCLACLATAAQAETAMTAAEFEAWSTGKTLEYDVDGRHRGSEMHPVSYTHLTLPTSDLV